MEGHNWWTKLAKIVVMDHKIRNHVSNVFEEERLQLFFTFVMNQESFRTRAHTKVYKTIVEMWEILLKLNTQALKFKFLYKKFRK